MPELLRAVGDPEHARLLREQAARATRIDALGVDRSRYAGLPVGRWSVEAQAPEQQLGAARAELTLADRIAAWRELFRRHARGPEK